MYPDWFPVALVVLTLVIIFWFIRQAAWSWIALIFGILALALAWVDNYFYFTVLDYLTGDRAYAVSGAASLIAFVLAIVFLVKPSKEKTKLGRTIAWLSIVLIVISWLAPNLSNRL